MDVIRAAAPAALSPAAALPAAAAGTKGAPASVRGELWAESVKTAARTAKETPAPAASSSPAASAAPLRKTPPRHAGPARLRHAFGRLEGTFLQSVLSGVLSAPDGGLYGGGLSGEYWKSLMAQAIAEKIADAGGLGVAASLMRKARPGPHGASAAASAVGVRKQFEARFLARLASDSVSAPAEKEAT